MAEILAADLIAKFQYALDNKWGYILGTWHTKWTQSLQNQKVNYMVTMIQTIGDLSLIYPSSGQFAPAKRLRSLQIGSDVAGYYNPNMNTNTVLTFNNRMLLNPHIII